MKAFSPTGKLIIATADTVCVNARIKTNAVFRNGDGTLDIEHADESSDVSWDSMQTKKDERGVYLFVAGDGSEWPEDCIHLEGEEPRAIPSVAPSPGLQVVVATFTHKHGTDPRVFADAAGAEAWRQAIARNGWDGFMNEDAPSDPVAKADRYFQRGKELADEFFETTTTNVEGLGATAAPDALLSALQAICAYEAEAFRDDTPNDLADLCTFVGRWRTELALPAIASATLPDAPAPGPLIIWTCTTEGDNCQLTTTVHSTEAEALERVRDDLRADCKPAQLEHLNAMPAEELPAAWETKNDGPCVIESHTVPAAAPASGDDTTRLDWLQGRVVDTVYLDDGKIIDVKGDDLREAIDAAKVKWPNSLEDDDGDEKPAAPLPASV